MRTFPAADHLATVRPLYACPRLFAGHAPSAGPEYHPDSRSRVARFLKAMDLDFLIREAPCGEIKQIRVHRKRIFIGSVQKKGPAAHIGRQGQG
jgi:hypothetical protein